MEIGKFARKQLSFNLLSQLATHLQRARLLLPFAALLLVSGLATTPLRADEVWGPKLRALAEKIDRAEKKRADKAEADNAPDPEQGDRPPSAAAQIRGVIAMIDRAEIDRIEKAIQETEPDLTGDLREEWRTFAAGLRADLPEIRERVESVWRRKVDAFVEETRNACLRARKASELEVFLVRCAPLQLRPFAGESPLADRAQHKLDSVNKLLQTWMSYLDQKGAGNVDAANTLLEELLKPKSPPDFPVLTRSEISSQLTSTPPATSADAAILEIYKSIKKPSDIPAAAERAYQLQRQGLPVPPSDLLGLQSLRSTWQTMENGAPVSAELPPPLAVWSELSGGLLARWRTELFRLAVLRLDEKYAKVAPAPNEGSMALLTRMIDKVYANGDFEIALKLMRFANDGTLMDNGWPMYQAFETAGLERLLGARRLEAAGEVLAAVAQYRAVLSTTAKYHAHPEAAAALKRLHAEHPDLLDDYRLLVLDHLDRLQNAADRLRVRTR